MPSMNISASTACDSGETSLLSWEKPGFKIQPFVKHFIQTSASDIPVVDTRWNLVDWFSTFKVRLGIGRNQYAVAPGLYAAGNPDEKSPVLVTANFKLTFDHLRKELKGLDCWLLVLNTNGVNVWCAAGKGTFATSELVSRIKAVKLDQVVAHKKVIVPQLGATGVSAKNVKSMSGFRVIYGPIRACDIKDFLKNNMKSTPEMRLVTFSMYERFILAPTEISLALKPALLTAVVLFLLSGIGPGIFSISGMWDRGLAAVFALFTGLFSGALVTPVLLPYLPGKTFALKGIQTGLMFSLTVLFLFSDTIYGFSGNTAILLFSTAVSSYLAMNFTGTTPFTSPSGVEKEMKQYIPVQLAALILSTGMWIYSAFQAG